MPSRLIEAQSAVRRALKGRMMLAGPPGAGKTLTGLKVATELAQGAPILGIDTEKESMLTYADDFTFDHLPWAPPYDPRELAQTIDEAGEKYAVILVDSLSHFWRAEGGTLDIANGKFTGWKDARPAQELLVETLLRAESHIVVTVRSKVEYTQELENGKHVVRKLGMAAQQDDNLEFEMNVAVDLTIDHTASIAKSRTTVLPVGRAFRPADVVNMATIYREWLASGEAIVSRDQVEKVRGVLNGIDADSPESQIRSDAKRMWKDRFGDPAHLVASRFEDALAFAEELAAPPTESAPTESAPTDDAPPADDQGMFE